MMADLANIDAGLSSSDEATRWASAEAAGELVSQQPLDVWYLVLRHGASANEDTRAAVATCMLEHLLEQHFDMIFPLLETEIRNGNVLLGDTLRRCWKLGLAELPDNTQKWDRLVREAKRK